MFKIPDLQVLGPPADKSDGSGGSGGTGMTTTGAIILEGKIPVTPDADTTAADPHNDGGQVDNLKKIHVLADLRIDGNEVHITATDIYRGRELQADTDPLIPEQDRLAVLARFTHTIDTKDLPFGITPTKVEASGGQIVVEGKGDYVTIDLDRLQQP